MRVVQALDAGPMLAFMKQPIGPDETSDEVERRLARLGADLLVSIVDRLTAGTVEEIAQDEAAATYAPRLTKSDGSIDWELSAQAIHDRIRGLHPWPHAFTFLSGHRYILLKSQPAGSTAAPAPPGTLVEAGGSSLVVATGRGLLRVLQLQLEGKRPMTPRELLSGHRLRPGDAFERSGMAG